MYNSIGLATLETDKIGRNQLHIRVIDIRSQMYLHVIHVMLVSSRGVIAVNIYKSSVTFPSQYQTEFQNENSQAYHPHFCQSLSGPHSIRRSRTPQQFTSMFPAQCWLQRWSLHRQQNHPGTCPVPGLVSDRLPLLPLHLQLQQLHLLSPSGRLWGQNDGVCVRTKILFHRL